MTDEDREKYPSEEAERFQVRMPPGLRDRIKLAASKNKRAMNTEIVARLEQSFLVKIEDLKEPDARLSRIAVMISEVADALKHQREYKLSEAEKEYIKMLNAQGSGKPYFGHGTPETKDDDK